MSVQDIDRLASPGTRIRAYISIVRPPNCLMIGLAVIVGQAISLGSLPSYDKAAYGFLTAALMMAGTMIFNDVQDLKIDRVNSPSRPLPSGRVTVRGATNLAVLLSLASLAFAFLLGLYSLLVAVLALGLMLIYNLRAKRSGLYGNVLVSFNVALPFVFGGISVSTFRPILLLFSCLAFLSNFGREVTKGISDVHGDSVYGVRTLAVLKGPRAASAISAILYLSSVIVSLVPPMLGLVSAWYLPIVIFSDTGFIVSSYLLLRHPTVETVRRVKKQVLLWMLLGLVAFLVGGLS